MSHPDPDAGKTMPTIGDLATRGMTYLIVSCEPCGRYGIKIGTTGLPQNLTMAQTRPMLRCSKCGAPGVRFQTDMLYEPPGNRQGR